MILKTIIKKIVLVGMLVSSSLANETFVDFTLGHSLGNITYGYTRINDSGGGDGYSSEGLAFNLGLRVGRSIDILEHFVVEPSIGVTTSFLTNIYSIELPVLYKYKHVELGPLLRYNYLSDIGIWRFDEVVKIEDKTSYSIGMKAIIVTTKIDYIFSYEYMLNAVYHDVSKNNNITTTTDLDMEGAYFSFGLRVKF